MRSVVFSCVVDKQPLYCFQGLVFARTLIELAGVTPESIVIHLIEGMPEAAARLFRQLGVRTVLSRPFDPRHPYSNKLVQLESESLRECDYAVLCDCDIAFAADVSDWMVGDRLRAKPVDYPNPPLEAWRSILASAGIDGEIPAVNATHKDGLTYANNFNGGFYIIPQHILEVLRRTWPAWNTWLLDNGSFLGRYSVHVDQISLALCMAELGQVGDPLPLEMNYPTHLPPPASYRPIHRPSVIHYHKQIDLRGKLIRTGSVPVDSAIDRINGSIEDCRTLDNAKSSVAFKLAVGNQNLRRALSRRSDR